MDNIKFNILLSLVLNTERVEMEMVQNSVNNHSLAHARYQPPLVVTMFSHILTTV